MTQAHQTEYEIIFLGLARNCAATVASTIQALTQLKQLGLRTHLIIGENGSVDGTRRILEDAAQAGHITIVDTAFMALEPNRLLRIGQGRARLAAEGIKYDSDFVGVIDLDEPFLESLSLQQLQANMAELARPDIFGIAATSKPTYYDLLAFEDETRSFSHLERTIKNLERHPIRYYRLFRDYIYVNQKQLTRATEIPCTSAFNGLALYSMAVYAKGTYTNASEVLSLCEHVVLNRSLASATGRTMVVSASLTLPTPKQHGRKTLLEFILQRTFKLTTRMLTKVLDPARFKH